jgi:tetratricopeptide (TPR) repeat protein
MRKSKSALFILLSVCIMVFLATACSIEAPATDSENANDSVNNKSGADTLPADTGDTYPDFINDQTSSGEEPERILVFSKEDVLLGLDKKLKYTQDELELIKNAESLYLEGSYEEANGLYNRLAEKSAVWQRDPLLLINWGMVQIQLDMYLDAQAKFETAVEKVKDNAKLKESLAESLKVLIDRMPAAEDYKQRKTELLRILYNLDKSNIASGLAYVKSGLENFLTGSAQTMPPDELSLYFAILKEIEYDKKAEDINKEELAGLYIKLSSAYLKTHDARQYFDIIKECADKALEFGGDDDRNPFLFYIHGLIKQYEGDMDEAVRLVKHASGIARNNKDIELWLRAYDPGMAVESNETKRISPDEFGFEGGGFNTYEGTLWLDDNRVLTTIYGAPDEPDRQYLILLDASTGEYKEVYEGEYILLRFITPDRRHVVLNDNGLKIVALDSSGTIRLISQKGYDCALSPDGETIAYSEQGIWLYQISSGRKKRISDKKEDISPIWFPDGERILFAGDLGGEEIGDGAGHLQGIFSINIHDPSDKKMIDEEWESKFHFIEWVIPGEIVHVEEGWDDGFESILLDIYNNSKRWVSSINDGETLHYMTGDFRLYVFDGNSMVKKLDITGRTVSRYVFGDIWGDKFGVRIMKITSIPWSDSVLFLYENNFQDDMTLWMSDSNFENPVYLAKTARDFGGELILSPSSDRVLIGKDDGSIEIIEIEPYIPEY